MDGDLWARAQRAVRTNLGLNLPAAKQWWNWQAKSDVAQRNALTEHMIHGVNHNNPEDAHRHAAWARQTAQDAGPIFTTLAGFEHELENLAPKWMGGDGLPLSESLMDLRNNREGVRAFEERRPIDPRQLQNRPRRLRPQGFPNFGGKR